MTTLSRLGAWKEDGSITPAQFDAISALVRKDRFSVFIELNALLYLGVLSFIAGVGWSIQTYFTDLGDAAILSSLTLLCVLCFYYCFSRARPYSTGEVESPNMAFDYVLYLGCLAFALDLGYAETQVHLLRDYWDSYLLLSSVLFFALAYRFDNRLVLALALSTLAGWFGVRVSRFAFSYDASLRPYALAYGVAVAGIGSWLHQRGLKRHFTESYFHIAANVIFVALLSGVFAERNVGVYLAGLLTVGAIAIVGGLRFHRFAFVAYGTVYSYLGISYLVLMPRRIDTTFALSYLIVSGSLVILSMVLLSRRVGRDA